MIPPAFVLYSKNFSTRTETSVSACYLVFPFSFTDFLFKELTSTVLTDGEKDINTDLTSLSSASVNFFYFFEAFCPPFREAAASLRREKEYITHARFVSSALFSFFEFF